MALTDFTIIRRSMFSRLFSTVTTIITVAVAVGLMLVLLSMRDAGRQAFERGSGNMHLLVSRDSSPLEAILNGIFYTKPPKAPLTWAEYEAISQRFPFDYAIPVQQGDSYKGFPTLATTPEFFEKFKPATDQAWALASGRYFQKEFEVVVGAEAQKATGLKLGDTIFLTHGSGASRSGETVQETHVHTQYKFDVVGILTPTGTSHDRALFINLNSSWILHAFDRHERAEAAERAAAGPNAPPEDHEHEKLLTVADLNPEDRLITGIFMRVAGRPGKDASALVPSVFDSLRRDGSLTVAAPSDQIRKLFTIVGNINQIFLAMAAAVMVSSGIAIMLALYNSMEQRRRQIAVLRVLGCSRGRIFGLVITESAILGMAGAAAGLVLGMAAGMVVSVVMKQRLGLVVHPTFAADWTFMVVVGTVGLASLAGVVPSVMAYRTPVAKNLKPIG